MNSRQNAHKIQNRRSQAIFHFRECHHASIAWRRQARKIRRAYYRTDRQLTRQDLKLLARGNPHRDEVMAAEADLVEAMMDDYFQDAAERDWYEYETQRELEEWYSFDDDFDNPIYNGPEPRLPTYADEEAWGLDEGRGLGYSHVDEDDSLMR